jgi:glycerol-3-phosphate cytidylyltransferase
MIIGYTTGVFDLFHIGHLNIIKKSKKKCDFLIVAVSNDQLAFKLKKKKPVIPFKERIEIIKSLKYVDRVIEEKVDDKTKVKKKYKINVIFKGDDWKNTNKWINLQKKLKKQNVRVEFLRYTKKTSSTLITKILKKMDKKN